VSPFRTTIVPEKAGKTPFRHEGRMAVPRRCAWTTNSTRSPSSSRRTAVGLVADHDDDSLRGDAPDRIEDPPDHRFPGDGVEHLREVRFHPRAFPRGKYQRRAG